jgi:type I restriction enzyme S subunit
MGKWVKKKLGDLGYSFSGLSGKTIDDFGGGKPYIPYINIFTNGKINSKQLEYVRIAENERQNKVEQGDWFFTTSSETPDEVGMTSVLVDDIGEAYLNSFCFGFRLYKKSEFDPEFVSYLFRSVELRKKISLFAQGSTRYNLPKQQMFEKLYISYPSSLSEQRRIASILSSADKVIDSTQKLIAKYKQIKQGMMEDLLKPKEGWKKVKLGEVGDFYVGGDVDKNSYSPYPTIDCKFPIYALG